MADYHAGKRYAQAVFAIAKENGTIPQWRSDLNDVATVLAESQLAALLADDRRLVTQRQALAERALDVGPLALNLAKVLIAKGRAPEARAVSEAFNRLADAEEGIAHADVTTAVPLSDAELANLGQRLNQMLNARVTVQTRIDPSVIGGVVIRVGDRIIDGSVKTRLKELRRELVGAR